MRRTRATGPLVAALATALGATACFSDRGLAIEIDVGSTRATSVELYLGKTACNSENNAAGIDCQTITPPGSIKALGGVVWFRDDDTRYVAAVTGHTATFQLQADAETKLPTVIAVGSIAGVPEMRAVGTATLRDLAIPIKSARIVTAALVAAQPVAPNPTNTNDVTEDRVQVWTKQAPSSTCVVVEHWTAGVVARDFVVPAEDPDCDGVVNECNPSAYLGSGASPVASCFVGSPPSPCVLGSQPCTDKEGAMPGLCSALHDQVCLPSRFCDCSAGPDPYPYAACLHAQLHSPGTLPGSPAAVPRVECTVPAMLQGAGLTPCNDNSTTIRLDAYYGAGSKCKQPTLVSLASLAPDQLDTKASFGGAVMELTDLSAPCSFQIRWTGGTHAPPDQQDPLGSVTDEGVIALPGDHGKALVPIVLHFLPGCSGAMSFNCHPPDDQSDSLWDCLQ